MAALLGGATGWPKDRAAKTRTIDPSPDGVVIEISDEVPTHHPLGLSLGWATHDGE